MRKCIITLYPNRYWHTADIKIDGYLVHEVNYKHEVTPDWIFVYDAFGGSGTGYTKGSIIAKIYIGDCELFYKTKHDHRST